MWLIRRRVTSRELVRIDGAPTGRIAVEITNEDGGKREESGGRVLFDYEWA